MIPARPEVENGGKTAIRLVTPEDAEALAPGVVLAGGAVIGQATVGTIIRGPFRKGSVGYWIGTPHQNQGHAHRAVGLLLGFMAGELGLRRAEASTQLENLASQHVLRANGFSPYGIAHSHIFVSGAWRDGVLWERIVES